MSKFKKEHLIKIFSLLSKQLLRPDDALTALINNEQYHNAWFTPESVGKAATAVGHMLNAESMEAWLNRYQFTETATTKKVGLILAGNIPLVGFHDVLCVLVSGHHALIKASSQDVRLIKHLLNLLTAIEPDFNSQYSFVDRLADFDAVIATGSTNTSRYFEYYFGKVPHIIRKNRNSVALLTGNETTEQLQLLGHDIFDYYGLGCRNVSKLLVPGGYVFNHFFESIEVYQPIINHHKYNNNYDYNKSIYLVNRVKHLDNGFLLLKEDAHFVSPLAVLFYQEYNDLEAAQQLILNETDNLQCIVTTITLQANNQVVGFGKSQQPRLWDYADGIDTMQFLLNL